MKIQEATRTSGKRIIIIFLMFFLVIPVFGSKIHQASAEGSGATFSGFFSIGVDSNGDGFFEFLEVGVEVNVTEAGVYSIEINKLLSNDSVQEIDAWASQVYTFSVGIQRVYFYFEGSAIYLSALNPTYISSISLHDYNGNLLEKLDKVPLSRKYLYTEFSPPGATLTGTIHDQGVDTDGNGIYDYLEVDVEVKVNEAGDYVIEASGLTTSNNENIPVSCLPQIYNLGLGVQVIHLHFDGPTIYASGLNPRKVSYIALRDAAFNILNVLDETPLSKEYLYAEFGTTTTSSSSTSTTTTSSSSTSTTTTSSSSTSTTTTTSSSKSTTTTSSSSTSTTTTSSSSTSTTSTSSSSTSTTTTTSSGTTTRTSTTTTGTSSTTSETTTAIPLNETPLGIATIGGAIVLILIVAAFLVLGKRKI